MRHTGLLHTQAVGPRNVCPTVVASAASTGHGRQQHWTHVVMRDHSVPGAESKNEVENVETAARIDRFDRRFSIEGDPFEALKVVLADNSAKMF